MKSPLPSPLEGTHKPQPRNGRGRLLALFPVAAYLSLANSLFLVRFSFPVFKNFPPSGNREPCQNLLCCECGGPLFVFSCGDKQPLKGCLFHIFKVFLPSPSSRLRFYGVCPPPVAISKCPGQNCTKDFPLRRHQPSSRRIRPSPVRLKPSIMPAPFRGMNPLNL